MDYKSVVSIDLKEAILKYRDFIHQTSLPHYKDPKFLLAAIHTYIARAVNNNSKKKKKNEKNKENDSSVVSHTQDMVWKTHVAAPVAYITDTMSLKTIKRKNSQFLKKPSPKKSKNGDKKGLYTVNANTVNTSGTQSRGKVIPLYPKTDGERLASSANKMMTFEIVAYQVRYLLPGRSYKLKLRSRSLISNTEKVLQVLRIDDSGFSDTIARDEALFQYDTACADVLQIRVSEIKMKNSSTGLTEVARREKFDHDYDLFNCDGFSDGEEFTLKFGITQKEIDEGVGESWVQLRCHVIEKGAINLFFGMKHLPEVSHTGHVCQVLTHPLLEAPHLTRDAVQPGLFVTKTLKNRRNETMYKCKVIKTEDGNFFCVEVHNQIEKMICCSYTVGHEVCGYSIYLDPNPSWSNTPATYSLSSK